MTGEFKPGVKQAIPGDGLRGISFVSSISLESLDILPKIESKRHVVSASWKGNIVLWTPTMMEKCEREESYLDFDSFDMDSTFGTISPPSTPKYYTGEHTILEKNVEKVALLAEYGTNRHRD